VQDDGKGFDCSVSNPGLGIIGMRERVFGYGGTLHIDHPDQGGTAIKITLPIQESALGLT
jgi:signal transduction histidine kinase